MEDERPSLRYVSRVRTVKPTRILLGDDDDDFRLLVQQSLSRDGYRVVEARDGLEVLSRVHDAAVYPMEMPDVVVLDVLMPNCSGLGVLEAMRDAHWSTPVIVMTGSTDETFRRRAEALGATAFFVKPFDMDDLRTAVLNAYAEKTRRDLEEAAD